MKKTILSKCFLHSVLLTLAFCLFPVLPAFAQEDIVDRLDKALGVTLPSEYRSKVKEFVANDTIMRTRSATQYTEEFIKDEMKKDWDISKQNQLLFMWSKIYGGISQAKLYNWLDDENTARGNEYKKALRPIADFYMEYKTGFKAYMEEKSAEADRRSAEADRRSAEADRRSAEADRRSAEADRRSAEADQSIKIMTHYGLYNMTWFYQHRGSAIESEIKKIKEFAESHIQDCEEYNIDYRSLLPLEVQKFYDIQPTRQNNLTCEKAMAQILTCTLKEMAKLYNLYQQAPQAERKIHDWKDFIEECKKNNVDYKAILLKELGDKKKVEELLKFYGVE